MSGHYLAIMPYAVAPAEPPCPESMDAPPLRWGILGTGWIADKFVTALHESTRQVVQAVGSRSRGGARAAADAFGATTAHASYEALVADPEVDVVYVATPHHLHLPHALLAIEAGKHVLVEKPVGLDAGEAREIGEAAARRRRVLHGGDVDAVPPTFDVVRQLLADGVVGERARSCWPTWGSGSTTVTGSCARTWPAARCSTSAPTR